MEKENEVGRLDWVPFGISFGLLFGSTLVGLFGYYGALHPLEGREPHTGLGVVLLSVAGLAGLASLVGFRGWLAPWWRGRPAVFARRQRGRAGKLAKLRRVLAGHAEEIRHLDRLAVDFPPDLTPEGLYMRVTQRWPADSVRFARYARLNQSLLGFRASPLAEWLDQWVSMEGHKWICRPPSQWEAPHSGLPGWDAVTALRLALKLQHAEWSAKREKLLAKAVKLQEQVSALSKQLGIEARDFLSGIDPGREPEKLRVETEEPLPQNARAKLAKVRADMKELREREAELEAELLDELPDDLPHRKAAGVHTDN